MYAIASPYILAYQIQWYVGSGDSEALSEKIDFHALRQSVKEMDPQSIAEFLHAVPDSPPMRAMKDATPATWHRWIDQFIRPEGIDGWLHQDTPLAKALSQKVSASRPLLCYTGWRTFMMKFPPNTQGGEMQVLIERRMASWQISGILLPPSYSAMVDQS